MYNQYQYNQPLYNAVVAVVAAYAVAWPAALLKKLLWPAGPPKAGRS
jgi:hypothetical protein